MNNSFSLQQIQKTSNLDANLISRQYKLNLMADFMKVKYENPEKKQSQIANQIGLSTSTLQRYRNDINMLSPYRINPNNTKKRSKKALILILTRILTMSLTLKDLNDLTRPQSTLVENTKKTKTKTKLKGGSIQENVEINEHYLDKILKNNDS